LDRVRHDPEARGFERERVRREKTAAPPCVVGTCRCEQHRVDALCGNVRDRVVSRDDVVPELRDVGRAWKGAPQPDDRDLFGRGFGAHGSVSSSVAADENALRSARAKTTWLAANVPCSYRNASSSNSAATPSSGSMTPMPRRAYARTSSSETMPTCPH